MLTEALAVTFRVVDALTALGVDYLVGGSLASSLHGIPRATQDVDVVAALRHEHVAPLVAALGREFYIDAEMIHDAIRHRSSFNVIFLESMFKVDVFVLGDTNAARLEMERRQSITVTSEPPRTLIVASPEDIVLQKLWWYKLGGGVSERQWNDVLGVLKVRGPLLDRAYLQRGAEEMTVDDLLFRALEDAGLSD